MDLLYRPLERIAVNGVVDRISYLASQTRGQVVLDLGAYDETALFKRGTGLWLHEVLSKSATRVIGIDNSPNLPSDGLRTGPTSEIIHGDIFKLGDIPGIEQVQAIVAGELIEHLPNALAFLRAINQEPKLSGKKLLATTPNASAAYNAMLGLINRESTHRDHLQIFSFKTLSTLCERAGFRSFRLIPYHVKFSEMLLQSQGATRVLVGLCERGLNAFECVFPLLAGGYIVEATLGAAGT